MDYNRMIILIGLKKKPVEYRLAKALERLARAQSEMLILKERVRKHRNDIVSMETSSNLINAIIEQNALKLDLSKLQSSLNQMQDREENTELVRSELASLIATETLLEKKSIALRREQKKQREKKHAMTRMNISATIESF